MELEFHTQLSPKAVYIASSIKELSSQAKLPAMDQKINITRYFHSAGSLLGQAKIYQAEGDLENAYILLLKFLTLTIEQLPKHKGYKEAPVAQRSQLKEKAIKVLSDMESIKLELNKLYEAEETKRKQEESQRALREQQKREQEIQLETNNQQKMVEMSQQQFLMMQQNYIQEQEKAMSSFNSKGDISLYTNTPEVPQTDMTAPVFFPSEIQGPTAPSFPPQEDFSMNFPPPTNVDISVAPPLENTTEMPPPGYPSPPPIGDLDYLMMLPTSERPPVEIPAQMNNSDSPLFRLDDLQSSIQEISPPAETPPPNVPLSIANLSRLSSEYGLTSSPAKDSELADFAPKQESLYRTPQPSTATATIPKPSPPATVTARPPPTMASHGVPHTPYGAQRMVYGAPMMASAQPMMAPGHPMMMPGQPMMMPGQPMMMSPGQPMMYQPGRMTLPPGYSQRPVQAPVQPKASPSPVPTQKPVQSAPSPVTTSRSSDREDKLRKMVVDAELFTAFMDLAKPNTVKDIETCGILAGTLKNNALYVTHLIVPKQTGSSDTCAMTHEEEVFLYQDEKNLMTLGWIHTHPSHDCFLSSVDMHTQGSYQFLLKEAVAVVVAPKVTPNFGVFMLNDRGLSVIQSCERRGFHPHEKGLYNHTQHVEMRYKQPNYTVVDLRKK